MVHFGFVARRSRAGGLRTFSLARRWPILAAILIVSSGANAQPAPRRQLPSKPTARPTVLPEKRAKGAPPISAAPIAAPASAAPAVSEAASAAGRLIRNVRATDPETGISLAEVAALVVADGYLVLPLEFVSEVSLAKNAAHFYVDDSIGKVSQEVFLADLDLDAGLALFKGTAKIIPSLPTSRMRESAPAVQDVLTSVVALNTMRAGAKFLRSKQDVSTVRYQISIGSGGGSPSEASRVNYVFDRVGQLVAVAMGPERDGATWAASGRSVSLLVRRAGSSPAPASSAQGLEARHRQLLTWQDRWTQALNPSAKGLVTRFLECKPFSPVFEDLKLAAYVHRVEARACESRFALPMGAGYAAGVEVQMAEAFIKPAPAFERNRQRSLGQISAAFASNLFTQQERSTASVNQLTTADCQDNETTNTSGQRVVVRFCTAALKGQPGLNDTSIAVSTLDSAWRGPGSHAYLASARLRGFGQNQTRRILEAMIENQTEAK